MRIKVGDQWFECKPGQPIMVDLLPGDKANIANMHPDATKYALFDDEDTLSVEQKLAWMGDAPASDGAEHIFQMSDGQLGLNAWVLALINKAVDERVEHHRRRRAQAT